METIKIWDSDNKVCFDFWQSNGSLVYHSRKPISFPLCQEFVELQNLFNIFNNEGYSDIR